MVLISTNMNTQITYKKTKMYTLMDLLSIHCWIQSKWNGMKWNEIRDLYRKWMLPWNEKDVSSYDLKHFDSTLKEPEWLHISDEIRKDIFDWKKMVYEPLSNCYTSNRTQLRISDLERMEMNWIPFYHLIETSDGIEAIQFHFPISHLSKLLLHYSIPYPIQLPSWQEPIQQFIQMQTLSPHNENPSEVVILEDESNINIEEVEPVLSYVETLKKVERTRVQKNELSGLECKPERKGFEVVFRGYHQNRMYGECKVYLPTTMEESEWKWMENHSSVVKNDYTTYLGVQSKDRKEWEERWMSFKEEEELHEKVRKWNAYVEKAPLCYRFSWKTLSEFMKKNSRLTIFRMSSLMENYFVPHESSIEYPEFIERSKYEKMKSRYVDEKKEEKRETSTIVYFEMCLDIYEKEYIPIVYMEKERYGHIYEFDEVKRENLEMIKSRCDPKTMRFGDILEFHRALHYIWSTMIPVFSV